jgi:hypothetical protein
MLHIVPSDNSESHGRKQQAMAQPIKRESTVVDLSPDPTVYLSSPPPPDHREWRTQLQARCVVHNIWDKISPDSATPLTPKPLAMRIPLIADYTPATSRSQRDQPSYRRQDRKR